VPIVVASYNIHRCIGGDGRFDPKRVRRVIEELDADVVALQEVETRADGGLDLLESLAGSEYRAIAGPTLFRDNAQYGNALLSRLPLRAQRLHDLSVDGREPRGAIEVSLGSETAVLRVFATHFGLAPWERRAQARRLLELMNGAQAALEVLLGDLNEWFLWGRPLRWLHQAFSQTPAPSTWPARCPVFALDRLWARPRAALSRLARHDSPAARAASDHLPLRAEFALAAGRALPS
jgi:endonuclease/exonuclease/phosphatase family metal-dependent hydrolase